MRVAVSRSAWAGSEVAPSMARRGRERIGGCYFRGGPASGRGWVVGGPHGCVAVGAVIPCAHRGGAALRDVWGGRCSGVRTQTPAMGHRLLRAGRLPVPPSIGAVRASLWKARTVPGFASPCWRGCVPVFHVMRAHVLRLCSPRSPARVSGGGARGARSSCRLHVKVPANP